MPHNIRRKKNGSTGPTNTDSSQGGAAAAGGNPNPAVVVALPSEETAKLPPTGGELSQVASTGVAGGNYDSGASNASGGNSSPPEVPDDDNDESWLIDVPTINVPTPPNLDSLVSKEKVGDDEKEGPNFKGTPVVTTEPPPVFINPNLVLMIKGIISNSGILECLGETKQSTTKQPKSSKDGFGKTTFNMIVKVPEVLKIFLKWLDISRVDEKNLQKFGELFPKLIDFDSLLFFHEVIIFVEEEHDFLDTFHVDFRNILSSDEEITFDLLYMTLKMLDEKDRLEALKQLVQRNILLLSEIEEQSNKIQSYDCFLIEILDRVNKGHLWKSDDVELEKTSIGGFVVSKEKKTDVSSADLTNDELNRIALETLKTVVSKHKGGEDCKSLFLLVCAIFRRILARSRDSLDADEVFWELLNVCETTGTKEELPMLCFDSGREYSSMKNRVERGSSAKPAHLSKVRGGTNDDLLSCAVLFDELMKESLVVDCSGTGTGKSLNWLIASIFHLVFHMRTESLDDSKSAEASSKGSKKTVAKPRVSSVFLAGPLNGSSAFLAKVVCQAIEEILRENGIEMNVISVDNAIVPRGSTKADTVRLYTSTCLDFLSVIMETDKKHPVVVLIDDHPIGDLSEVLRRLMKSPTILKVVACGASIDPTTIDTALRPIIRGIDTTKTLSSISSRGHICPDVPLTIEQLAAVKKFIDEQLSFYINNMVYLKLLYNVLSSSLTTFVFKGERLNIVREFLLRLFPTQIESLVRFVDETDEVFLKRFLIHFTKLYMLLMLKTRFKRDVVEKEYKAFLESGEICDVFEVAKRFSSILKGYMDIMKVFIFREPVPELPSGIIEMSKTLQLNKFYQKVVLEITKVGFVLPDSLCFPKPVSVHDRGIFEQILKESKDACRFLMTGPDLNPIDTATRLYQVFLHVYGKVKTEDEKQHIVVNRHQQNKNGENKLGANSRSCSKTHNEGSSKTPLSKKLSKNKDKPESPDNEPESPDNEPEMQEEESDDKQNAHAQDNIDMTSSMKDQIDALMKAAAKVSESLSSSAPVPNHCEIKAFVNELVKMRSPISSRLVKFFASGIFIPMPEMPFGMIKLAIGILEQGRLIFVIQEGREAWDMRSQNFQFKQPVFVFFLSEVSWDFFLQNCLGRFGRMYQEFLVYVSCMTGSGRIVAENIVPAPVVKAQGLSPNFDGICLDENLMSRIKKFVSECFSLSDDCLSFLMDFLAVFSNTLYDKEFKYATHGKSYDEFFRFLSCYLSSRFCGLEVSGAIDGSLDHFLTKLAVAAKSRTDFKFLADQLTLDNVVKSFVAKLYTLLDHSSIHKAASLCCAIQNRVFPGFNHSLLVSMFFSLKDLVKFVDLLDAFLRNMYSSSFTSINGNDEVRPMITFLGFLRATMEELSSLIASKVEEGKFIKALAEKRRLGCLKAPDQKSPIECLKEKLLTCMSISDYMRELQQSAADDDKECRKFLVELKRRLMSYGPNSNTECLHKELIKRLPDIDLTDQGHRMSISELDATESEMNEKVIEAQRNVKEASSPMKVVSTTNQLKKLNEEAESLKKKNYVSRQRFLHLLSMNERERHDIRGQIEECNSLLRKYGSLSEEQFLAHFLSENFD
jgi:hypothetical protein